MARARKPIPNRPDLAKPSAKISRVPRSHPYFALVSLIFGVLFAVALFDFDVNQTRFLTTDAGEGGSRVNLVGGVGADIAFLGYSVHGLAVWVYPFFLVWFAGILLFREIGSFGGSRWISLVITFVASAGLLTMIEENAWEHYEETLGPDLLTHGLGGLLGRLIYSDGLKVMLGPFGSVILLGTVTVCAFLYTFSKNVGAALDGIQKGLSSWWASRRERASRRKERKAEARAAALKLKEEQKKTQSVLATQKKHLEVIARQKEQVAAGNTAIDAAKAQRDRLAEQAKAEAGEHRFSPPPATTNTAPASQLSPEERYRPPGTVPPFSGGEKRQTLLTNPPRFGGGKLPPPPPPPPPPEPEPEPEKPKISLLERLTRSPFVKRETEEKSAPEAAADARNEVGGTADPDPATHSPKENPNNTEGSPPLAPRPSAPVSMPPAQQPSRPAADADAVDLQSVRIVEAEKVERTTLRVERRADYQFPPMELLQDPVSEDYASGEDHMGKAQDLKAILDEFKVKVSLGEIHTGPVITRYEVTPAPGVRVEKISSLDKNIALGLKAEAVRILAPVPGKGVVGVEVPNRRPQPVCLRDIIESRVWNESKADIPIALGKEVSGRPIVADLTKMPHLLIAGSTGSGKTVCINAIIASLLFKYSPEDLRFIMVDPKIVEMQAYNALPHMLIPVVTEPKKVPGALKWLLGEMERRYRMFAEVGVRNIAAFNARLAKNKEEELARAAEMEADMTPEERAAAATFQVPRESQAEFLFEDKKLPFIVCIVDELADLMMVAPADIETGIARLAQLARAAGIHLIIATQRPSVNVITGVIKANLPSRIAFRVASKIDSRTILDQGGAEALIGKGDMLFTPPGSPNMVRAQGAFVSDEEINGIVEFLKVNGPPQFLEEVQATIDSLGDESEGGRSEGGDDAGDFEDALVPKALDVLRASKRASTSMLQRRLRIGYNRAARLMEELEELGIVGPENGSSPREILVDLDTFEL